MSRLDAIAIVSTGIVSSLLTLPLRAAPALGKIENPISNVRQERTLPVESNNNESQTIAFTANVSSENAGSRTSQNGRLLTLAAVGIGGAGVIWSLNNRQNQSLSLKSGNHHSNFSIERANPRLRNELLRLVGGDRKTANRLIAGIKLNHPEKSLNWAVEKAIYDLERDR